MATRPVFVANDSRKVGVRIPDVEFEWYPGFSDAQKRRSVESLHHNARAIGVDRLLEVSRRGTSPLGRALSAFNLTFTRGDGTVRYSVEAAFQGSKVFVDGGPFRDLLSSSPLDAKRDPRLRQSGRLVGFSFFGAEFSSEPPTEFYDWLYICAMQQHSDVVREISRYAAFTDIEFNPNRSINCQAHAVALFVSMLNAQVNLESLADPVRFRQVTGDYYFSSAYLPIRSWGVR